MTVTPGSTEAQYEPGRYEIRIKGHLDDRWTEWFEDATITQETSGETRLTATVIDQAALYGLLRKVRDLGLTLISVIQIEPKPTDLPDDEA